MNLGHMEIEHGPSKFVSVKSIFRMKTPKRHQTPSVVSMQPPRNFVGNVQFNNFLTICANGSGAG